MPLPAANTVSARFAFFSPTSVLAFLRLHAPLFAAFLGLLAVLPLYRRVSGTLPANSDYALVPLQADAVVHGDTLLHGWTVVTDALYATEVPFYVAAIRLQGFSPDLLHTVPSFLYALVVLCVMRLAAGSFSGRAGRWAGTAMAFALVGLPSGINPGLELLPSIHLGTYLAALAAVICLDVPGPALSRSRLSCWTLLCTLAVAGDTYALWVLILPAVLVCGWRWWAGWGQDASEERQARRQTDAVVLGLSLLSVVLAKGALKAVHVLGGFHVLPFSASFVPIQDFGNHVQLTVEGLLKLFHADFFGLSPGSVEGLFTLACLPGLLLAAVSLRGVHWPSRAILPDKDRAMDGADSRVTQILAASVMTVILAYLFSTAATGIATTRYLLPCLLCGAALTGRVGAPWMLRWGGMRVLTGVIAITGCVHLIFCLKQARRPDNAVDPPVAALAGWLTAHNLTNGYGDYWSANITTLQTRGSVTIRSVASTGGGIAPLQYNSASPWYRNVPAYFLVIGPFAGNRPQSINVQNAVHAFGLPAQTARVGTNIVLVWDKDITPQLQAESPQ